MLAFWITVIHLFTLIFSHPVDAFVTAAYQVLRDPISRGTFRLQSKSAYSCLCAVALAIPSWRATVCDSLLQNLQQLRSELRNIRGLLSTPRRRKTDVDPECFLLSYLISNNSYLRVPLFLLLSSLLGCLQLFRC